MSAAHISMTAKVWVGFAARAPLPGRTRSSRDHDFWQRGDFVSNSQVLYPNSAIRSIKSRCGAENGARWIQSACRRAVSLASGSKTSSAGLAKETLNPQLSAKRRKMQFE
jgi:hypothetical protein